MKLLFKEFCFVLSSSQHVLREPMVVNDVSSSDNDIIHEDDSDIVLDDIVAKKPPEKPSAQTFTSMVAHSLPLLPSNSGEVKIICIFILIPFLGA